jgi:hypothetical protein
MFSIFSTSLRALRACRLKAIPGSHAGKYFTEQEGFQVSKQNKLKGEEQRRTHGLEKGPQLESLGFHIQRVLSPQFQKFGRICRL